MGQLDLDEDEDEDEPAETPGPLTERSADQGEEE